MYIVLVGPSGCRKGTAMGPGQKLLNDMGIKLASEAITREALIRELCKSTSTNMDEITGTPYFHSSLTIFSQELTVFLGYNNQQLMADLCDWFDCRDPWKYTTKNQGEDNIIGVWVNLIGATTPELLQSTLPRDAIGGGLTARMILVYAPRKGKTVVVPFETAAEKRLREQLFEDLQQIQLLSGDFKVTEEFMELWASWYREQDRNPPFRDARLGGYTERRPIHTLKLSLILSASRSDSKVIEKYDLMRAIELLAEVEQNMLQAYSGIGKSKISDIVVRVLAYMASVKESTEEDLMQTFYFDADSRDMNNVLDTLHRMGSIRVGVRGNKRVLIYTGKSVLEELENKQKEEV